MDIVKENQEIQQHDAEHIDHQHGLNKKISQRGNMLNRWPRAFARLFDLIWEMTLVASLLIVFLNLNTQNILSPTSPGLYLLVLASLPLALMVDAIIAGIFTNTPAKALIGVKATSSRGQRLGLLAHSRRNFGVWTDGLAMGIAPLSVFSMMRQFKRVSGRREAFYDERMHTRMRTGRYAAVRVLLPLISLVGLAVLLLGSTP